ncbi:EamA family transporter [Phytomonospora endophytica]|uniref:Inner membrane transporter RhtA n=1 Tax=Phytomonospora endophytica TaxID=714109 RepID=A0A841FN23_9ACTN|nr:EamA family transporter [Phytomonospora endophytica]MBB6035198.1 inner membrane transporter RhtA [Phytomonospora endophytica]GIG64053.1 membrane protein [Phytomonospora endophytica]
MTVLTPAPPRTASPAPAVALTLGSMSLVQVGLAASTSFFDRLTPAGTTWLRLSWAAVILLIVVRPKPWRHSPRDLAGVAALGAVSAGMTLLFAEAASRLPIAAAVAIGFLGPLGVGVMRRAGKWGLLWPPVAFGGVVLLTEPWHGPVNVPGLAFAVANAFCWAGYVLLTQKVADKVPGLSGLAMSMTVSALVATAVGASQALPRMDFRDLYLGAALALLIPVLPYAMEMLALRRIAVGAFGTLLSLEPAIALVIGWVALHQVPAVWQFTGIGLVTIAAIGAARAGRRGTGVG